MSEKSLLSAFCPKLENYPVQMFEVAWTSFTHRSSLTGSRDKLSNGNPTRGFQVEARSTATELERSRQEGVQENGHQLGRGWRGCGRASGIVSSNASLTPAEPETRPSPSPYKAGALSVDGRRLTVRLSVPCLTRGLVTLIVINSLKETAAFQVLFI